MIPHYDDEGSWILEEGRAPKGAIYLRGEDTHTGEAGYCIGCHQFNPDGPDICFGGYIPNVAFACCGHGVFEPNSEQIYVVIGGKPNEVIVPDNRIILRGKKATAWFKKNIVEWSKPKYRKTGKNSSTV